MLVGAGNPLKINDDDSLLSQSPDGSVANIMQMRSELLRLLKEARDSHDIIKMNCVYDKLAMVQGLLKISQQSQAEWLRLTALANHEDAHHEGEKISLCERKTTELLAEARACVGVLVSYVGLSTVNTDSSKVRTNDNDGRSYQLPDIVARPPSASPYL